MFENKYDCAKIISLLSKNEAGVAKLYQNYAKIFPESANFWKKISNDELIHANKLSSLIPEAKKFLIEFNEQKVPSTWITESIDFLKSEIEKANKGKVNLKKALKTALDIEKSVIEKDYFGAFLTQSKKALKIISEISKDTDNHAESIEIKLAGLSSTKI